MRTQYIQSMMQTERSSVGATSRCGAHPPGFEPVVLQKKNPLAYPMSKARVWSGLLTRRRTPCTGGGRGSGVFSACVRRSSS